MHIDKVSISRDPKWYEAWPDVVCCDDGTLLCVFSECRHHDDRSYTRVMMTLSRDGGRCWEAKRALSEATGGMPYFYNCARIAKLASGRLVVTVDKIPADTAERDLDAAQVMMSFSDDNGASWSEFEPSGMRGIVPDKLLELESGRLLLTAHRKKDGKLAQFLCYSDDGGNTWSDHIVVAADPRLHLCEASLLSLGGNTVVALLRENSLIGLDAYKVISYDGGESWSKPLPYPLSGCHRPNLGHLSDGRVMATYRFLPCCGSQSFFGAVMTKESLLSVDRREMRVRIFEIDYDRAEKQDTGYSGFAQLPGGEVFIVNYIVDDHQPNGQIRGYLLDPDELILPPVSAGIKLNANN